MFCFTWPMQKTKNGAFLHGHHSVEHHFPAPSLTVRSDLLNYTETVHYFLEILWKVLLILSTPMNFIFWKTLNEWWMCYRGCTVRLLRVRSNKLIWINILLWIFFNTFWSDFLHSFCIHRFAMCELTCMIFLRSWIKALWATASIYTKLNTVHLTDFIIKCK